VFNVSQKIISEIRLSQQATDIPQQLTTKFTVTKKCKICIHTQNKKPSSC